MENSEVVSQGTRGFTSRRSKRPTSLDYLSTYSSHYSKEFRPGDTWKVYYRLQKMQEYSQQKRELLMQMSRWQDENFMHCLLRGFKHLENEPKPRTLAPRRQRSPDFYVRPWQQQLVPALQSEPCPLHGFDRGGPGCPAVFCHKYLTRVPYRHSYIQKPTNPYHKYMPEPVYLVQDCAVPSSGPRAPCTGVPPSCLTQPTIPTCWCQPRCCRSEERLPGPCQNWPNINKTWHLP